MTFSETLLILYQTQSIHSSTMDVMLQRHCAKYIYIVPDGLRELLTDISREVLRSQPENIYIFVADYLDALMITRENARIAAKLVQNLSETTETIMEFLDQAGMLRPEADRVTNFIQEAIHEYFESLPKKSLEGTVESEEDAIKRIIVDSGITEEQADVAAKIIQEAFRNYKMRKEKERELLSGYVDWRVAAKAAIKLYRKTGVSNEEAARAATLIKAAYKGYYTRRIIRRLAEESQGPKDDQDQEELEMKGEEDYDDYVEDDDEDGSEDKNKEKGVRINFDTVIPHVDFDEPLSGDEETQEAAAASAKSIIDDILVRVVPSVVIPMPAEETKLATIPEESGDASTTDDGEFVKDLADKDLLPAVSPQEDARVSRVSQPEPAPKRESENKERISVSQPEPALEPELEDKERISVSQPEPALEPESEDKERISVSQLEPALEPESEDKERISVSQPEPALEPESENKERISVSQPEPAPEPENEGRTSVSQTEPEPELESDHKERMSSGFQLEPAPESEYKERMSTASQPVETERPRTESSAGGEDRTREASTTEGAITSDERKSVSDVKE